MGEKEASIYLQSLIFKYDLDWIIYQLVKGAVKKRAEVDEGENESEKAFWQSTVVALSDFQSRLEGM